MTEPQLRTSEDRSDRSFFGHPGVLANPEAESPFFIWVASVVTAVVVMLASKPIHTLMAGVD